MYLYTLGTDTLRVLPTPNVVQHLWGCLKSIILLESCIILSIYKGQLVPAEHNTAQCHRQMQK